jgi:hypothetical protein
MITRKQYGLLINLKYKMKLVGNTMSLTPGI